MEKKTTIESSFARLGTVVSGRLHKLVMFFPRLHWSFYLCGKKRDLPSWKFQLPLHFNRQMYYVQYHNRVHVEIGFRFPWLQT